MKKSSPRDAEDSCCAALALQEVNRDPIIHSRKQAEYRREAWGGVHKNGQLRPLCYEHHISMGFKRFVAAPDGPRRMHGYVCPAPGCSVGYNRREGYFMMVPRRAHTERDIIPCVRCPHDGQLMYLAQTNPDNRSFRLWKCPLCGMSRTNREVLKA
jgi:hypothetical protein